MPILANAQHERFCQERANGKSIVDAYTAAGYARNDSNSARLNGNERIRARILELQTDAAARLGIDRQWVLNGLKTVAERCMQGVEVLDGEGEPTGEWKFDSAGASRALVALGKDIGMFVDRSESTIVGANSMEAEDLEILRRHYEDRGDDAAP